MFTYLLYFLTVKNNSKSSQKTFNPLLIDFYCADYYHNYDSLEVI